MRKPPHELDAEYFLPEGIFPVPVGKPTFIDLGNGAWEIRYPGLSIMYDQRIDDGELCERCGEEEATEVYGDTKHVCHDCAGDYRMEE